MKDYEILQAKIDKAKREYIEKKNEEKILREYKGDFRSAEAALAKTSADQKERYKVAARKRAIKSREIKKRGKEKA